MNGQDGEVDDEGEESMDDDTMDKISSSPPIDDGGYSHPWPSRDASLSSARPPKEEKESVVDHDLPDSSLCVAFPTHPPLSLPTLQKEHESLSEDHHQKGGYSTKEEGSKGVEDNYESEREDRLTPLMSDRRLGYFREDFGEDTYDADFEAENLSSLLLPVDDPLLENSPDDEFYGGTALKAAGVSKMSHEHYWEASATDSDDDDTDDISFADSRFIDSGWGGQCLRETEDIDFEFVYALHTFVATVEGQANATKGDTMVLLDDSNSYWWLVKVVKDSSIGRPRTSALQEATNSNQGYLPAEHIETPTERLARLNKHRNIDVSKWFH